MDLSPAEVDGERPRHAAEWQGLFTVLLGLGLSDLEGVVPRTPGPPSPASAQPLQAGAQTWTIQPRLRFADTATLLELELCDPFLECVTASAGGSLAQPQLPVAQLLSIVARALDRSPADEVREGWVQPLSKDDYAVLLAGRSAAHAYGLLPATPEESIGHQRRDPIDRAVLVDPFLSAAGWLLLRRDAARELPARARTPLPRARASRPWSVVLEAEDAVLVGQLGRSGEAADAWRAVLERAPVDPRFQLPAASALLQAQRAPEARRLLDSLPPQYVDEPGVVALRVGIADALEGGAPDALLAHWQAVAPTDPEPVRRRISLQVAQGAWSAAVPLARELGARGVREEADRLLLALAAGAHDWAAAERAAQRLGLEGVAAELVARPVLDADPAAAAAVPPGPAWELQLARGRALLAADQPGAALSIAAQRLQQAAWDTDALELAAAALEGQGRAKDAAGVRARLSWVDPSR